MSRKESDRLGVIQMVCEKRLRQREAAEQLGLSVRQVKRLVRRFRDHGAPGLISRHRDRQPNNALADDVRTSALALIRDHYQDFGPTLAHEKLVEVHGHAFSVETLRQWMIEVGLWQAKSRHAARIHQRRPRRACLGELVQIDGSPHDWFEERGPRCTLIVFIDDASGRLLALRFAPSETTQAYMETLKAYLAEHGRPLALYSDRHGIFRHNSSDGEGGPTQFSRLLKTLEVEAIFASTPQAKGRVERANRTLQDRLVKELRLRDINDLDRANDFVEEYRRLYNARFEVTPRNPTNAHRSVPFNELELSRMFCRRETRTLSKNLTCQFDNIEYQIVGRGKGHRLRGKTITVCRAFDGSITLLHNERELSYQVFASGELPAVLADHKTVNAKVDQVKRQQAGKPYKPSSSHPWNQAARIAAMAAQAESAKVGSAG